MPFFSSKSAVRKIRVLRIINRFNIGGPTYNATFLTAFLDDRFETLLVGGMPDAGEADSLYILEQYGVKPLLMPEMVRIPNVYSDRKAYLKLKELMMEFKPDIVHTHASKAGALGRQAAFACSIPVVIHTFHGHVFHSYFGKLKTLLYKNVERRLAKRTDAIIAISDGQKRELCIHHRIAPEEKFRVINLGFDLSSFYEKRLRLREEVRADYKLNETDVAIAIIGRLAPIKNHDFFFETVRAALQRVNRNVRVFIVGDGVERERLEKIASEINTIYPNTIVFTSWIKDIGRFNAAMDIICLTSKNEGTPVSLIEAQAANIPVITTNVGGVKDVVLEGETGHIIENGDLQGYTNCLVELINDEKKRMKMSQNGWNFVKEKFHYDALVKKTEALYIDLLKKKGVLK